ncbi:MAG: CBS domain-containing protein [Thermoplasmata archaeon]|nr:CBS domain-containing protein [Thermoplasmata archaeon]
MKVEEVMTKKVITLKPSQTVAEAVNKLAEHHISGAPVMDETGKTVGILTEKDILNALKTSTKSIEMVYPSLSVVSVAFVETDKIKETMEAFSEISNMKVSDIMVRDYVFAEKGTDLAKVVEIMGLRGINRVPVLDSGKLVGIVSRADIIKGLAKAKAVK